MRGEGEWLGPLVAGPVYDPDNVIDIGAAAFAYYFRWLGTLSAVQGYMWLLSRAARRTQSIRADLDDACSRHVVHGIRSLLSEKRKECILAVL